MNSFQRLALITVTALAVSCSSDPSEVRTVTMWHFWSEPAQQAALKVLVEDYKKSHPFVNVELVPLSWNDGKSKLQMAFNAGKQPDIVHLGLDWFGEFDESRVFIDIDGDSLLNGRGRLWVQNARALVHWSGDRAAHQWGFAQSDAHNVVKRALPFLWDAGAPDFYTSSPIHKTMDDRLVLALQTLRNAVVQGALLEHSRSLDERLLRGEIRSLYTGAWIMDMAREQGVYTLTVEPKRSILNADVLAVTTRSGVRGEAESFVGWLADYPQAAAFCLAVSDAGFPMSEDVFADTSFQRTAWQRGFLETVRMSSPLPASPVMLRIEPIIETMIERCYQAKDLAEIQMIVADARARVQDVEAY